MAGEDRATRTSRRDRGAAPERTAFDRSDSLRRGGSVGAVLLVALALVAAAAGVVYVGRPYAQTYLTALLAVLATIGVLALFALAAGILRPGGRERGHPLLKTVV